MNELEKYYFDNYKIKDVIFLMQACINSYKGKHGKEKKIFDVWQENIKDNVEYYFGVKGKTLHIIFRGSDRSLESQKGIKSKIKRFFFAWKDWFQNLDFNGINIANGTMHQGIYEDHIKIDKHCFSEIKKFENIVITGHSKGAMQAALLYYFARLNYPDKNIDGFGFAPGKNMSKHFKESMKFFYTIINKNDFIPKLPWHKFRHMGKIIRFGKRINPLMFIPFIRVWGVKDHYPQEYLKSLKEYVEKND